MSVISLTDDDSDDNARNPRVVANARRPNLLDNASRRNVVDLTGGSSPQRTSTTGREQHVPSSANSRASGHRDRKRAPASFSDGGSAAKRAKTHTPTVVSHPRSNNSTLRETFGSGTIDLTGDGDEDVVKVLPRYKKRSHDREHTANISEAIDSVEGLQRKPSSARKQGPNNLAVHVAGASPVAYATVERPKTSEKPLPNSRTTDSSTPRTTFRASSNIGSSHRNRTQAASRPLLPRPERRSSPEEDRERRSTIPESPPLSPTFVREKDRTPTRGRALLPEPRRQQTASSDAPTRSSSNVARSSRALLPASPKVPPLPAVSSYGSRPASSIGSSDLRKATSSNAASNPDTRNKQAIKERPVLEPSTTIEKPSISPAKQVTFSEARPKTPIKATEGVFTGDRIERSPRKDAQAQTPKRSLGPVTENAHVPGHASPRKSRSPSKKAPIATAASSRQSRSPSKRADVASAVANRTEVGPDLGDVVGRKTVNVATDASLARPIAGEIERIVGQFVEEMRNDNEYMARIQLQRARHSAGRRYTTKEPAPTSVFQNLVPVPMIPCSSNKKPDKDSAKFIVETKPGTRHASRSTYTVDCIVHRTVTKDVPQYSHYVGLKHNLLAPNETNLYAWPYFHDDFDPDSQAGNLKALYFVDVDNRERKLKRLGQAEEFMEYADDMLSRVGCRWVDVLRFLLDPDPFSGPGSTLTSTRLRALEERDKHNEDLKPDSERWTYVLSRLPPSRADQLDKAALLCEQFFRIAKFPLWHVARRTAGMRELLMHPENEGVDLRKNIDKFTCRICMRLNCPVHGEVREVAGEGDSQPKHHDAETDIINPPSVNFRYRIHLPESIDNARSAASVPNRKNLDYWQKGQMASLGRAMQPGERGPFYPCHHPGLSCDRAHCSCFKLGLPCEKICACSPDCARKFQGCQCSSEKVRKGQKMVCFEDDRCTCFQLGRECDPDLCGECGVCDVLDPIHRQNDRILQGRCNNASIQRGIAKHTILGDSGIHGLGLYACEDIRGNQFVGEYKGEVVTSSEGDRRGGVYHHQQLSYLFALNKEQDIDGTTFGSKMRFINCATKKMASLYARTILVNSVHRIGLYASRDIKAGEELFFDYGPEFGQALLGGKSKDSKAKERKAAPKTRNSGLVSTFVKVDRKRDSVGNLVAMPKASTSRAESDWESDDKEDAALHDADMEMDIDEYENAGARLHGYNVQSGDDEEFDPDATSDGARDSDDDEMDSPEQQRPRTRRGRGRTVL